MRELIRNLISYKTVSGNDKEFRKCFDYIKEYFSKSTLLVDEYIFNNRINLFIRNSDEDKLDVLFVGHIDVVSAQDNMFTLIEEEAGNRLIGRGTFDMKSHVAVMMQIMLQNNFNKKVGLYITSDEEEGGFNGLPYLFDKGITAKFGIVPDGGNDFELVSEEKGVLWLKVIAEGKNSHASKPWEGDNAVVKLINLYNELIKRYPLPENEDDFITSINLSSINGGESLNQVPQNAEMFLDIRHINKDKKEKILEDIKSIDKTLKLEINATGSEFFTDLNDEFVKKYVLCCENVLNKTINIKKCTSASDARFFTEKNIPAVIMNSCGGNMHSEGEFVILDSLYKLKDIYTEFLGLKE